MHVAGIEVGKSREKITPGPRHRSWWSCACLPHPWSCGAGSALLGRGVEGAELRQQGLRSTLDGFGSSGGALGVHGLQQVIEVGVGVAEVDVAEDPRQRCGVQDACRI